MSNRDLRLRLATSYVVAENDDACVLVTLSNVEWFTGGYAIARALEAAVHRTHPSEGANCADTETTWHLEVTRGQDLSDEIFDLLIDNCVEFLKERGLPGISMTHVLINPEAATKWRAAAMSWATPWRSAADDSEESMSEALRARIHLESSPSRSQEETFHELTRLAWGTVYDDWSTARSALLLGVRAGRQSARRFDRWFEELSIDEFSNAFDVRGDSPDLLDKDIRLVHLARLLRTISSLLGVKEDDSGSVNSTPASALELSIDAFG